MSPSSAGVADERSSSAGTTPKSLAPSRARRFSAQITGEKHQTNPDTGTASASSVASGRANATDLGTISPITR